ncbi:MAG: quinate 5-dehydrogenase, partial [Candidatus Heimdallarchaeota archaeon]|nr:quinate 5-dehydrogenase [Candidatus Heimdallarchaeota archaeon]
MSKHVISISLGSSARDYKREYQLGNETILAERIGTNGDMKKYNELMLEYDGKIDAFGVGGADMYLRREDKRYEIRDVFKSLIKGVKQTPIVDGGGIKSTLEGGIMQYIEDKLPEEVEEDRSTLNMCAVDRWHMAESAWEFVGKDKKMITFGDLLWGFQLKIALHRMRTVKVMAKILLPIVCKLPFSWLYPTGEKQDIHKPTHVKFFKRAKWIAGDFLFINRNMPHEDMEGKIIVTNTTREHDIKLLKKVGIKYLITSTPIVDGVSFGTNVLEASIVALSGEKGELTREGYEDFLKKFNIEPNIQ